MVCGFVTVINLEKFSAIVTSHISSFFCYSIMRMCHFCNCPTVSGILGLLHPSLSSHFSLGGFCAWAFKLTDSVLGLVHHGDAGLGAFRPAPGDPALLRERKRGLWWRVKAESNTLAKAGAKGKFIRQEVTLHRVVSLQRQRWEGPREAWKDGGRRVFREFTL